MTAVDALNRLDGHASLLAERLDRFEDSDFELQPLAQHLDRMYGNYVMSSQRGSHQAELGHAEPKDETASKPKIELF